MLKRIGYSTLVLGLALARSEAAPAAEPTPIVAKAETKHYRLELDIGGMERMYARVEAAKLHPKDGWSAARWRACPWAAGSRWPQWVTPNPYAHG